MTRLPVALRRVLDFVQRHPALEIYEYEGKPVVGYLSPSPEGSGRQTKIVYRLLHDLHARALIKLSERSVQANGYFMRTATITPEGAVEFRRRGKSAVGARRGATAQVPTTSEHPDPSSGGR